MFAQICVASWDQCVLVRFAISDRSCEIGRIDATLAVSKGTKNFRNAPVQVDKYSRILNYWQAEINSTNMSFENYFLIIIDKILLCTCSHRGHTTADSLGAGDNSRADGLNDTTVVSLSSLLSTLFRPGLPHLGPLHHSSTHSLRGVTNNVDSARHGLAQRSEGAPGDALLPLGSSCS